MARSFTGARVFRELRFRIALNFIYSEDENGDRTERFPPSIVKIAGSISPRLVLMLFQNAETSSKEIKKQNYCWRRSVSHFRAWERRTTDSPRESYGEQTEEGSPGSAP
jgi:hypothetical protein